MVKSSKQPSTQKQSKTNASAKSIQHTTQKSDIVNHVTKNKTQVVKSQPSDTSSAKTDQCQVSRVFTEYEFESGSIILDYGGGRCDKNIEYMKKKKCTVLVYDPYNRSKEYNNDTWSKFEKSRVDYMTCSNVLNVIKDDKVLVYTIRLLAGLAKTKNAKVVITVYEGDKSGIGKQTTRGWQRNCKLYWYKTNIDNLNCFEHVYMKNDMLICY